MTGFSRFKEIKIDWKALVTSKKADPVENEATRGRWWWCVRYGLHLLSDVQLVSMCHLLSSPSTTWTKPKNSKMLTMEPWRTEIKKKWGFIRREHLRTTFALHLACNMKADPSIKWWKAFAAWKVMSNCADWIPCRFLWSSSTLRNRLISLYYPSCVLDAVRYQLPTSLAQFAFRSVLSRIRYH